jgi:hypothetical protein
MVPSVSSKRAFSSARITICKRRNHLDGDIVEALQCLKPLIHQNLLRRDVTMAAKKEINLDYADEREDNTDNVDTTLKVVEGGDHLGELGLSNGGWRQCRY